MYDDYKYPPCKHDGFKEAVSIEAQRIFDTCSERDCICDLQVTLDPDQTLSDSITAVKTRCVDVSDVCISVDCVPFKNGYYAVDITYTFSLEMDAYEKTCTDESVPLTGTAVWNKRVILYGSKGSIKTFDSEDNVTGGTDSCCRICSKPKVSVSVVEPIALDTRIACVKQSNTLTCDCDCTLVRSIVVTIGLFSVIKLTRPVSLLIPTYDYCLPDKECCVPAESPKDVFCRLEFPSEEFFPCACKELSPAPAADIPPENGENRYEYLPENEEMNG